MEFFHEESIRTFIWTLAKLITAFAFFAIPWEMRHWRKELGFESTSFLIKGIATFFFFCGLNQFVNAFILEAAPWWAVIFVSIPMMVSAMVAWFFMWRNRAKIVGIFDAFHELMTMDLSESMAKETNGSNTDKA